jgi:hypothetical protein
MLPSVGKTLDEINSFMEGFGFNEKLTLRGELPFTLTTDRSLTNEEVKMINTISNELNKLHPEWKPSLKSFDKIS